MHFTVPNSSVGLTVNQCQRLSSSACTGSAKLIERPVKATYVGVTLPYRPRHKLRGPGQAQMVRTTLGL